MSNQLTDAVAFFIKVFSELALLFIVISFLVTWIQQKLPSEKIKEMLAGNKGYSIAVGLGSITPFCSCSTLPMTIALFRAGAAFGPVMTFLFTSPLLNPFIIGLFWVSFSAKITVIYAVFVVGLAIISGFCLEKLKFQRFIRAGLLDHKCHSDEGVNHTYSASNKTGLTANQTSACGNQPDPRFSAVVTHNEKIEIKTKWKSLFSESLKQFISFVPYMVIGVAVGALLHGYVPSDFFSNLADLNLLLLIPLAAIIGVFLYVRASTMVPIATSLVAKGMSIGAVISLTIAGAGASLPEMIMMKKMFHWPLLATFTFLVFSTACITGFAVEIF